MTAIAGNALVLGASSEMGRAIASDLIASGTAVLLTFNSNIDAMSELINVAEAKGLLIGVSQLNAENGDALKEILNDHFHSIALNIVVNCIGVAEIANITDEGALGKWRHSVNVNLNFLFEAAHLTLPLLKESSWGRWINISSVSSFETRDGLACYSVTKAAQNNLIKFMAKESGAHVTVNSICPGMANTPHVKKSNQAMADKEGVSIDQIEQRILKDTYTNRLIDMDEISGFVRFLCTNQARSITGQSLIISGGRG